MNCPVSILGVSRCEQSSERNQWKSYAAANAASYAKEIIKVMGSGLMSNVKDIAGTETIVPPHHMHPRLPPFQSHQYINNGNTVLLVIPTENESKKRLLEGAFRARMPN